MIHIRTSDEIKTIWHSCQIVKDTLILLEDMIQPGVTTLELDRCAETFIRKQGGIPGFKGLFGYPATLCISIDDEVVHGIPGKRKLKEGEIVGIDVGVLKNRYYGDHARTFSVGKVSADKKQLMKVTKECLIKGIEQAKPGNRIGDISYAIQKHAEDNGYGVVKELVGHGIGTTLHEEPQIPNYGRARTGPKIESGMCFAIEPMINMKSPSVFTKKDNWTVCTADGEPSAHFEHTIVVEKKGAKILTI
ncbi:MAG: type I methionyl aminopeptidase [Candidatus Marinimicrobia bacterium]|nr:type I methionyl aminopeptidase [Candidatus Neomarinimicrobiota bacterium]MBL7023070.1 type I methionyl aminopeptidase [Candidatus Neomarinimicrobiota bacterium]MBL7109090.1 type I methionyl aminopeptidase [Candidatus Neomarinimicrobiota bacterium]